MPETPTYLDDGMVSFQYQIWATGKAAIVEAIPNPTPMQKSPDPQFRLRVLPANAGHHAASSLAVDNVHRRLARSSGDQSFLRDVGIARNEDELSHQLRDALDERDCH